MAEAHFRTTADGATWQDQYEAAYDTAEAFFGNRIFVLDSSRSWSDVGRGAFEFTGHKQLGEVTITKACCQTAYVAPHHHRCEQGGRQ